MESTDDAKSRDGVLGESGNDSIGQSSNESDGSRSQDNSDSTKGNLSDSAAEGSDNGISKEDENNKIPDVEDVEIHEEFTTTPLYRRAVSLFDPDEKNVQLIEHWEYMDEDISKRGYF